MDFNLSTCKLLIATHADADHIQGIARAKELFKAKVAAHPLSKSPCRPAKWMCFSTKGMSSPLAS
jgi:glyoxylase-like metal-dependent hydrolase (beta-lactamase superfamily II)